MLLLTDGFFEWSNEAGEQFGIDRLRQTIHNSRHKTAEGIIAHMDQSIRQFVGDRQQDDDMTTVVIKRSSNT